MAKAIDFSKMSYWQVEDMYWNEFWKRHNTAHYQTGMSRNYMETCLTGWLRDNEEATERQKLQDKYDFHLGRALWYRRYVNASRRAKPRPTLEQQRYAEERRSVDAGHAKWHLRQARDFRDQLKSL
jgi:hypothetical protein